MRALILGGTTEARELAEALHASGVEVTTSLAGRVARPHLPPGAVRIGGFGGSEGLRRWVAENGIDAVIDATHPFAERISEAAEQVGALRLERPGWNEGAGDLWVDDMTQAAAACSGHRVLLTTGHQGLEAFTDGWFLVRTITRPNSLPPHHELLLDRGPFTLAGERALLERHAIDLLVTKDSGGPAPKLQAARERGCEVVIVRRPKPRPPDAVSTVEEAVQRITAAAVASAGTAARAMTRRRS
jgi:precorrin-6A/cobalt-precorrin-6A reductase